MASQIIRYVNLNWREAPHLKEIVTRIIILCTEFDKSGSMKICRSKTEQKELVPPERSGLTSIMYLMRQGIETTKKWSRNDLESPSSMYCIRMYELCRVLVEKLDAGQEDYHRTIVYQLQSHTFPEDLIVEMIHDLALTIGIHPFCLGWLPDR